MVNDFRPMKSLEEAWRQYRAWAVTANALKNRQYLARIVAVVFGILGAALGTLAGKIEDWLPIIIENQGSETTEAEDGFPWAILFAVCSAAAVALAGYIGRELLTPDRETGWSRCRLLAEALKREVWRGLMQTPPYDNDNAANALLERAASFIKNTGLQQLRPAKSDIEKRPLPQANDINDYISQRVCDQIRYYENQSDKHQGKLQWYKRLVFILGAVAVLLGLSGIQNTELPLLIPVVTMISGGVLVMIQSSRIKSLIPLYQETAVQLRFILARWNDQEKIRRTWMESGEQSRVEQAHNDFIATCEEIMARENESWRAEWINEESEESLNQFLNQVKEVQESSPSSDNTGNRGG